MTHELTYLVSCISLLHGDTQITNAVRHSDPRHSCSNRVSVELRKGTWRCFFSARAQMTLPRCRRDELMYFASFLFTPSTRVLPSLSLPARSQMSSFPHTIIPGGNTFNPCGDYRKITYLIGNLCRLFFTDQNFQILRFLVLFLASD